MGRWVSLVSNRSAALGHQAGTGCRRVRVAGAVRVPAAAAGRLGAEAGFSSA
jgi:hypothetical protein